MREKGKEVVNMVAISLYRGNLHRVPDVPRRWLMPHRKISLKDFKSLLSRRSKALSRLHATTSSIPNPNPLSHTKTVSESQPPKITANHGEGPSTTREAEDLIKKEPEPVGDGDSMKKPVGGSGSFIDSKNDALEKATDGGATSTEKQTVPVVENVDASSEKEKRKKEVEDKLQVLNAKKHNLVLVLKQILGAEEELKRRNSMQGIAMRGTSVPIQGDGMIDTGVGTRHMPPTPRLGSEGNPVGDVDGGEADDFANHTMHSRHILRPSSMSPSAESPLRRTPSIPQNAVSHPSRSGLGATGSPSRFALSGHQGNSANLPSVSVSGTSYIASSPSPAASGGTSYFRDARQPSPWK